MKNNNQIFLLILSLLFCSIISCQKKVEVPAPKKNTNYQDPNAASTTTSTTAPYVLTFWSKGTCGCGNLEIWVNGYYQGTINQSYVSAPSCGATGCVTVGFTTTGYLSYAAYSTTTGAKVAEETLTISKACDTYFIY